MSTSDEHAYACLSYVWGDSSWEPLTLTRSLVERFSTPGALKLESGFLPQTIADAMYLVPLLGLRYLWVDRLCIAQDDEENLAVEIAAMVDIYSGSAVTIIAANSSGASAPLWTGRLFSGVDSTVQSTWRGMDGAPAKCEPLESRKGAHEMAEWVTLVDGVEVPTGEFTEEAPEISDDGTCMYPHDDIMHMLSTQLVRSKWNDRGWTFQEWFSSHRKLVFHEQSVNWDCHCASWHEAQADLGELSPCQREVPAAGPGLNMEQWPNWYRLNRLICQFNIRQLSYPEDVLDAFEGTLSVLAGAFSGGFISGMPRLFFDTALLWQPYAPGLQRRQPRGCEAEKVVLPTWSWVSCYGNLDSTAAMAHSFFTVEEDGFWEGTRTFGTVAWEHAASLDGPWEAVAPPDSEDRGVGWSAFKDEVSANEYFTHPSAPGKRFWYPVKICDSAVLPTATVRSRYLRGKTRYGKLFVADEVRELETGHLCPVLSLRDSQNRWVGFLRVGDVQIADALTGTEVDLIEMSTGETKNTGCPFLQKRGVMVNVMCVADVGRVFQRLAVGRLDKDAWSGISVQRDVTLG